MLVPHQNRTYPPYYGGNEIGGESTRTDGTKAATIKTNRDLAPSENPLAVRRLKMRKKPELGDGRGFRPHLWSSMPPPKSIARTTPARPRNAERGNWMDPRCAPLLLHGTKQKAEKERKERKGTGVGGRRSGERVEGRSGGRGSGAHWRLGAV